MIAVTPNPSIMLAVTPKLEVLSRRNSAAIMDGNVAGASTENTMYRKSKRLVIPRAITIPMIPKTIVITGSAFWIVSSFRSGLTTLPISYMTWVVPKIRNESKDDITAAIMPAITSPLSPTGK